MLFYNHIESPDYHVIEALIYFLQYLTWYFEKSLSLNISNLIYFILSFQFWFIFIFLTFKWWVMRIGCWKFSLLSVWSVWYWRWKKNGSTVSFIFNSTRQEKKIKTILSPEKYVLWEILSKTFFMKFVWALNIFIVIQVSPRTQLLISNMKICIQIVYRLFLISRRYLLRSKLKFGYFF